MTLEHTLAEQLSRALNAATGAAADPVLPHAWRSWLPLVRPNWDDLAPHHEELWSWAESILPDRPPIPFLGIWPRGGGKTSTAETICSYVAEQGSRRFALYVSATADQAEKRVQNVQATLETLPGPVSRRLTNAYGQSKAWRQQMLRTESGFNILGCGLDSSVRSLKLDEYRPDFIIFDDIDSRHDTTRTTRKKIETIAETILPAKARNCAILVVQNRMIANGVVSQIWKRTTDILSTRIVSGPIVAVEGLVWEWRDHPEDPDVKQATILSGRPTWAGYSLADAQDDMRLFGPSAFLREQQQQVDEKPGALFTGKLISKTRIALEALLPKNVRAGFVGVDPPNSTSTECGIVSVASLYRSRAYVVEDRSEAGTPDRYARSIVEAADKLEATYDVPASIVVEMNNGGQATVTVIQLAAQALFEAGKRSTPTVRIVPVWASVSKGARAEPVQVKMSENRFGLAGEFPALEGEMTTYLPGDASPNRLDAMVWAASKALDIDVGTRETRDSIAIGGGRRR